MIYKVDAKLWGVTYRFRVSADQLWKAHEKAFEHAHEEMFVNWRAKPHEGDENGLELIIEKVG